MSASDGVHGRPAPSVETTKVSDEKPKGKGRLLRTLSSRFSRNDSVSKASAEASSSTQQIRGTRDPLITGSTAKTAAYGEAAFPSSSEASQDLATAIAARSTSVTFTSSSAAQSSGAASSSMAQSSGAASSSSSFPEPSIDGLLHRAQALLGRREARATSSKSKGTALPEESKPYVNRADQMIEALGNRIMRLRESHNAEQLQEATALQEALMQWVSKEKTLKTEMVVTLMNALGETMRPEEFSHLGFGDVKTAVEQFLRAETMNARYESQLEVLRSFDQAFHHEETFRQLARHCAGQAVAGNSECFEYRRLPGGAGYTLALGIKKQMEGEKDPPFFRIFVCKPITAQPGGDRYLSVLPPITAKDVSHEIDLHVKGRIDELGRSVWQALQSMKLKPEALYLIAKEAEKQGFLPQEHPNDWAEEDISRVFNMLGHPISSVEGKHEIFHAFRGLFHHELFSGGPVVNLMSEEWKTDPALRGVVEKSMEEDNKMAYKAEKMRGVELVEPFRGARGVEVNHAVFSGQILYEKYPSIFEKQLLSVMEPLFPTKLQSADGELEVDNTDTMVMEYCINRGSLEQEFGTESSALNRDGVFYQDQIEKRFITGLILGFADQNIGNELILEDQLIQFEIGHQRKVRLASIDMGQAMPDRNTDPSKAPFYIGEKCLRTPEFYGNIASRIQNVDFSELINDLVAQYDRYGMPLSKEQIQMMIVRCENLKIFAKLYQKELQKGAKLHPYQIAKVFDFIVRGYGLGAIVENKGVRGKISSLRKKTKSYKIGGEKYYYERDTSKDYGLFRIKE